MNTKFELLKFVEEFETASKTMQWDQDAAKLYVKFPGQLELQHRSFWMDIISEDALEADEEPTFALFESHVQTFAHDFFMDDDYSNQIDISRIIRDACNVFDVIISLQISQ